MNDTWYQVIDPTSALTQGDMIVECPLLGWGELVQDSARDIRLQDTLEPLVSAFCEDVIVMTQACDLQHRKVKNVVVCPHVSLSTFRQIWQQWMAARGQNPSEKAWKHTCEDIANGYVWNQAFLNPLTANIFPKPLPVFSCGSVFLSRSPRPGSWNPKRWCC